MGLALFTIIAVLLAIFASPLLGVVILAVGCVLYFADRQRRGDRAGADRSH
jgi:hypothetical protein